MKHELSKPSCKRLGNSGAMWMVTFTIVLIASTVLISRDSEACCFYNKSDGKMHISFNCGWFCGNVWTLEPGEHKCRPGKGGVVNVRRIGSVVSCDVSVEKHGWVDVTHAYPPGGEGRVESKNADGVVVQKCYFAWGFSQ